MNPTQIARRADALYSGTTKRDMSYMVAYRESDIEDLRTLCADLWSRAQLTVATTTRADWMERMSKLGVKLPDA